MTAPTPTHPPTPEELLFHAEAAVIHGVLGNAKCFVFVPFDAPAFSEIATRAVHEGLWYCGLLGLNTAGDPLVLCEPDADSVGVMARALPAFVRRHGAAMRPAQEASGDAVDWLHGLFALDDPRGRPTELPN